jgi:beta-lactamase regulating signal transducer with metallopeptidase domain
MTLNGPVAVAIGWALLHLLWQGTIVAAILGAALALMERRSANARYLVSCSALALLLVLGIATAVRAYEPVTTRTTNLAATQSITEASRGADVLVRTERTGRPLPSAFTDQILATARQALPSIVLVWLIGVALLSSRLMMTWLRTQRLARHAARAANDEWHRVVARLASAMRLRRVVRLVESAAIEVPSVIGWLRPVILLPASTVTGLAPRQIEMVLAHELAHIRRHDFFINLLQAVVETLMFYHPAVWWMSRRVRIERENCCDDLAVAVCGDAIQYARALARLEELRASAPEIAMAANGGALMARIRRIAGSRAESIGLGSRWAAAVAMLSILAIAIAVPSLPALAQREEPKPAKKAETPKKSETVVEVRETRDSDDSDDPDPDYGTPEAEAPEVTPPVPPMPPGHAVHVAPLAPMAPFAPMAPGMPAPMAMVAPVPPVPPTPTPAPMAMVAVMAGDFAFDFDGNDSPHHAEPDRPLDSAGRLTVDELISLRAVNVTPDYIRSMRELFPGLTIRGVISLRAVHVTPEFIREMRSAGFDVKTSREATSLAATGVTAEWMHEMKAAGVEIHTAREATSLRAVGVTPDLVRKLAKAGYTNLTARELTRLAAAGVNDDFIRDMEQYRKK